MLSDAIKQMKIAFMVLLLLSVLTGIIYPAVVTVFAQIFFPWRANGSLIVDQGKLIGSELIGQSFTESKYFWGRPSATSPYPYNAALSTGSNDGPMNPNFLIDVRKRIALLQQADAQNHLPIPVDLVTASASGLDPDISPYAAFYQVHRIAIARQISEDQLKKLIESSIQQRTVMLLGEARVNVLQLNLALDALESPVNKTKE